MDVYIPSRGRAHEMLTLFQLPRRWQEKSHIVCPASEAHLYQRLGVDVMGVPDELSGIHHARQWVVDHAHSECVFMIDDDMKFAQRDPKWLYPEYTYYLPQAETGPEQVGKLFDMMESWMEVDGFVHIGIDARQMNVGRKDRWWRQVVRMNNAYGHNVRILKEEGIRWDRLPVMEDFDVTLCLLKEGYPNQITVDYVWNQRGSGKKGGCSSYRNLQMQAECAHRLAALHAPFVQVVEKSSKSNWEGMETRTDVQISWRKAFPGDVERDEGWDL